MHAPDASDGLPAQTDVTGAMDRVLQRLASTGAVSRVSVKTFSTSASVIERGAPDRGASTRRARRCSKNWRSPLCHRRYRQIQFPSHVDVCFALAAQQNDSSSPPPRQGGRTHCSNAFLSSSERVSGWVERLRRIVNLQLDNKKGHGLPAGRAPFGRSSRGCLAAAASHYEDCSCGSNG